MGVDNCPQFAMRCYRRFPFVQIVLLGLFPLLSSGIALAQTRLSNQSRIQTNGIGAIRVGMTVREAEGAAGIPLVPRGYYSPNDHCYYVAPEDNTMDISFMVTGGTIVRVDIGQESEIVTLSGVGIGDSEERILSLFPGQIEIRPHPYVQGHYLEFVPRDRADANYRVIFETSDGKVNAYRAGQLPEVNYIEGCS